MTSYFAPYALLPGGLARDVTFDVDAGAFTSVTPDSEPAAARRLDGVVVPGFANAHSHAFHRALRARTHADGGTFWTWRRAMYAIAGRLDPDGYLALARAAYAEMALAGITSVGEFHYLHHAPGGVPYAEPNVMGEALIQAARDAGIRLTLLDTCYLTGGLSATGHEPLDDVQRRFADASVEAWQARAALLGSGPGVRAGRAIHSVRAVPEDALRAVPADGGPLHVHLSEQPAENEACVAFYGRTPTRLLADAGLLGPSSTAVHATHVSPSDIDLLGAAAVTVCVCPTTERDLADGIGPTTELREAGCALALGSDQHAVVDMFEEARGLELDDRLRTMRRGRFTPRELLEAATDHACLGWPDAGVLEAGARADLVCIDLASPRTAGADPGQVLFAASSADVRTVIVDGVVVVEDGRHRLGGVGDLLRAAVEPLWAPS